MILNREKVDKKMDNSNKKVIKEKAIKQIKIATNFLFFEGPKTGIDDYNYNFVKLLCAAIETSHSKK